MPTIQTMRPDANVSLRRNKDQLVVEQDFHIRIRADDVNQDRLTILYGTPGVPLFNVIYGSYGMLLSSAEGDRHPDDPLLWDCVYHLSNVVEEGADRDPTNGNQQTGDPTVWIPMVELGFEEYDEVLRESLDYTEDQKHTSIDGEDPVGYNAKKWLNSAGQPYDTGFVRRRRIITRQFTQFEKASGVGARTLDQIMDWHETINDGMYLNRAKRTLMLTVDKVAIGTYYSVRAWRVDMTLHYKKSDWRIKQLDVGWNYKASATSTDLLAFTDKPGNSILGALDGKGLKAADPEQPAIRYHKEFEDANFASFLRLLT
jgi:hypothetical protein